MYARDRASQGLGMVIEEVRPGYARLRMTVRPDMLNGHDICHGGFIFALAEFGLRLRLQQPQPRHGRRGCRHRVPGPGARPATCWSPKAEEQALGGRLGVYDVVVRGADGDARGPVPRPLLRGQGQR